MICALLLHLAVRIETTIYRNPAPVGRAIVPVANCIEGVQRPTHAMAVVIDQLSVASRLTAVVRRDLSSDGQITTLSGKNARQIITTDNSVPTQGMAMANYGELLAALTVTHHREVQHQPPVARQGAH